MGYFFDYKLKPYNQTDTGGVVMGNPLVGVIMGSQSAWETMYEACDILSEQILAVIRPEIRRRFDKRNADIRQRVLESSDFS